MSQNRVVPEVPRVAEMELNQPKTVIAVKVVEVVMVSYRDEEGRQATTLGIVGENGVHLLDSQVVGMSRHVGPTGPANKWLRDGVFAKLGRHSEIKE